MLNSNFSKANFRQCLIFGVSVMKKQKLDQEPPLIKVTVKYLLKEVDSIVEGIPQHRKVGAFFTKIAL